MKEHIVRKSGALTLYLPLYELVGVFAREGMWYKKCPEMINQRLCFLDGKSVVASLRCLITACLITRPWYLPFPNICVGLNGDLRLIPVSLVH